MKPWITKFFAAAGIVAVLGIVPAACMSQKQADDTNQQIGAFTEAAAEVVGAIVPGAGAAIRAGGALSKAIVGLLVAAPAAGGAVAAHKMNGGALTPKGRRKKKQENANWDALLAHAEELAKAAPAVSEAVGGSSHVSKQADAALKVIAALKAAQAPPAPAQGV